jgi:glycosyltransferase involved in cell wall biosynthesis
MRIAVWAGSGIGGTEKAATLFAIGLAKRGYQVDFLGPEGPRTSSFRENGITVHGVDHDETKLLHYMKTFRPNVVHQHVPGSPINNPIYKIWADLGSEKPHLIETNVFGKLEDPIGMQLVEHRTFISMASAVQAFQRAGKPITMEALQNHTPLYYPVETFPSPTVSNRTEFRKTLGITDDEILAVRIGQPSKKWKLWECQAFAQAKKHVPRLRLMLLEPPLWIWNEIQSGKFGEGILLRKATQDFAWLKDLYASADFMVHASDFGESFGYTIAEAMVSALPVIVRTTPWGDNAQVELIENGKSGYVCAGVGEMSRRMVDLATNIELRKLMGAQARERIGHLADFSRETDVLEAILQKVCETNQSPILKKRSEELLSFAKKFNTLEWNTSETAIEHPIDYLGARFYSSYRSLRSKIRRVLDTTF